ncbi:hypothetical protein TNCT_295181 [Trichonephila clavata]|uniref:Uncharacterized protein n=1 Tax=Trichonephila clavata TaxID=2740835 RepID=A0A8X6H594_TRICU|nr:hypothetical protein TNCT_295181 [Trichonephila clavata]
MNSTVSAKRSSGKRLKKRKFTGNMYTRGKAVYSVHESLNNSASGKKIQLQDVDSSFIENNDGFDGYRVFDKNIMFTNIQNFASCKKCGGDITPTEQCSPFKKILTNQQKEKGIETDPCSQEGLHLKLIVGKWEPQHNVY